jgi:proline iminopeptidase
MRTRIALILAVCIIVAAAAVHPQTSRESILDRIVRTQRGVDTALPRTFRWCDSLHMKTRRVDAGGAELFVEEEGSGVPLVLINGGPGGTHHYFHPWFSRLKDRARVIYYDQRGCGRSDFTPGPYGYSTEQAVDDLDAVRKALGIDRWVVLGYSYGGFVAQYYALRYPGNVSGLILLGAAPGTHADLGPPHPENFVSDSEQKRIGEIPAEVDSLSRLRGWPKDRAFAVMSFNMTLNGDWKRQHFYKPTPERAAQMALYEWVHDAGFNDILNRSEEKVDLARAFDGCPAPTLILEGKWDFTWDTGKREALQANHPGSTVVLFENSSHGIYDEEPERFFGAVGEFLASLPAADTSAAVRYGKAVASKGYYEAWNKSIRDTVSFAVESAGLGRSSNERMARSYRRDMVNRLEDPLLLLKVGFALYDAANYSEALMVFEKMEGLSQRRGDDGERACAVIWQAHMLDLLGRRAEAVERYRAAADLGVPGGMQHGQYGMKYSFTPYAKERMRAPFVRIENREERP